mmetsp:Transcript_16136/g.45695  ORF Transcript_16136/g.45695 Transcript_16136/m.45695 type:complete len:373 (+) Transcript_16136:1217-2335(+)
MVLRLLRGRPTRRLHWRLRGVRVVALWGRQAFCRRGVVRGHAGVLVAVVVIRGGGGSGRVVMLVVLVVVAAVRILLVHVLVVLVVQPGRLGVEAEGLLVRLGVGVRVLALVVAQLGVVLSVVLAVELLLLLLLLRWQRRLELVVRVMRRRGLVLVVNVVRVTVMAVRVLLTRLLLLLLLLLLLPLPFLLALRYLAKLFLILSKLLRKATNFLDKVNAVGVHFLWLLHRLQIPLHQFNLVLHTLELGRVHLVAALVELLEKHREVVFKQRLVLLSQRHHSVKVPQLVLEQPLAVLHLILVLVQIRVHLNVSHRRLLLDFAHGVAKFIRFLLGEFATLLVQSNGGFVPFDSHENLRGLLLAQLGGSQGPFFALR